MQAFVVFSSAAGVVCSGGIRFHSTGQQENSSVQRQGPCSGCLPLIPSQMIQNAFGFQVFCYFSEQNHLLWNKC